MIGYVSLTNSRPNTETQTKVSNMTNRTRCSAIAERPRCKVRYSTFRQK